MNIKMMYFSLTLVFLSFDVSGFELEKGLLYQTEMPSTLEGYKEYYLSHSLPENSIAYIKNTRSDYSYYTLNRDTTLFDADLVPKTAKSFFVDETIISKWPLTPWPNQTVLSGERAAAADRLYGIGVYEDPYGNDYWKVADPATIKVGENVVWKSHNLYIDTQKQYGCLAQSPLRYGDIDGGGSELVLFIGNQIKVFSPTQGKTVFEFNWINLDDLPSNWMQRLKTPEAYDPLYKPYLALGDEAPQYVAASSEDKYVEEVYPAWRSFAKFYTGDFNNDELMDIIVWRKLYESRTVGDDIQGFYLKAQGWVHYSLVNGEYQMQTANSQETIQGWLSDNNLTWQKGFPSLSECAGEEGQLIPEMHDPLLNDPDVLK